MHSRRSFLIWLCSGLAAGKSWIGTRAFRGGSTPLEGALARVLRDPRSARRIGAEYARAHPDVDVAALRRSLAAVGLFPERWDAGAIAAQTRRDFEEDRIVRVGGWMLAESEAQVCALVFLVSA